jgi:3-oxoacyl-[acyl-carrier protein] reductase
VGDFNTQTVIVTGAAGDFGRVLCAQFAAQGAHVVGTDLVEVPAGFSGQFVRGDITQLEFVRDLLHSARSRSGRIDVLVNNAGICPRTPLDAIALVEWRKVFAVNLEAAFLLAQACLPVMQAQGGGAIVNIASLAAKIGGIAVGAHYTASKAALIGLTKTLARNGGPAGVRCNCVAPGIIAGTMTQSGDAAKIEEAVKGIPLGRQGTGQDVAEAVLFLASARAAYITGATLDVNGGLLMD